MKSVWQRDSEWLVVYLASAVRSDPALPRIGTDFMTLRVVIADITGYELRWMGAEECRSNWVAHSQSTRIGRSIP
jgi:hypothetical protein